MTGTDFFVPNLVNEFGSNSVEYHRDYLEQVLAFYASLYFPYPYLRLGFAPISDRTQAALGPLAQILYPSSLWVIDDTFGPEEQYITQTILAHEVAHQYFFNWVKLGSNEPAWLSESFAEYSACRMSESFRGDQAHFAFNYWNSLFAQVDDAPALESEEISSDEDAYFPIVYLRGSALLEQLRKRYSNFDEVMRIYVDEHPLEFTSTQEWVDTLQREGELTEQYQRFDLATFLEKWLLSSQVAEWTVTSTYVDPETTLVNIRSSIFYPDSIHFTKVGTYEGDLFSEENWIDLTESVPVLHSNQGIKVDPQYRFFRRISFENVYDLDLNGVVDGFDLFDLEFYQGINQESPGWVDGRDLNRDGQVSREDLNQLERQLGRVYR